MFGLHQDALRAGPHCATKFQLLRREANILLRDKSKGNRCWSRPWRFMEDDRRYFGSRMAANSQNASSLKPPPLTVVSFPLWRIGAPPAADEILIDNQ